jgi:hypothetical protein
VRSQRETCGCQSRLLCASEASPHQFRTRNAPTKAIEFKRKDSKINEPDRYSAAHNGLVAGSSPGEPFTISMADHLHGGEGLRPRLQKFVAAIALSRGEEIGKSGTSLFIRSGIQLYHAFLKTILLWHGQLHHVGDDHVFRCALYWPLYQATPRKRVRLSPVPESQVEGKGDETSHTVVARKR